MNDSVNNKEFKLTPEAVSHLVEVLRLYSSLKQIMNELVNEGVEDVERQIFEARFNTLMNILIEYSNVKVKKREVVKSVASQVEYYMGQLIHKTTYEKRTQTVVIYNGNEAVIDEEVSTFEKVREEEELYG